MAYSQIIPLERTFTVTYDSGTTSFIFSSTPDLKYGQTYKFIINSDAGVRFIFSSASTDPLTNYISDGIYYTPEAVENASSEVVNAETYGIDSGTIILTVGHDLVSPIYYGDPDNWTNTNDSLSLGYEQLVIDRGNTFEEWRVKTNVLSDKFGDFSTIDSAYTGDDVVSALNEIQTAASSDKLGLVKIGYASNDKNYPVQLDSNDKMFVNVPWVDTNTDTIYTLPAATSTTLGGVKLGSNTQQSVAANSVTTAASRTYAIQNNSSGQLVVNVPWVDTDTNTIYTLPTATNTVLGGVKLGSGTTQTVAANGVTSTASRTYAIQKNSSSQLVVNVPWVDTNTNTTYSAGTGLSLSGTTFSLASAISPSTVNGLYVQLYNSNSIIIGASNTTLAAKTTSASYNIALGLEALKDCYTGDYNTAIGHKALTKVTTGGSNTSIGYRTLEIATSGAYNTALGRYALFGVTTGSNNTGIGNYSGSSSSPSGLITTGSNIICLGNNSTTALYCADTTISSSDVRDKSDIEDFTHGLDWVNQMRPVTYKWDRRSWYLDEDNPNGDINSVVRDGSKKKSKINLGLIAQEVLAIESADGYAQDADSQLLANENEDGTSYGIKYDRIVPVLINAIKELSAQNEELKARLDAAGL